MSGNQFQRGRGRGRGERGSSDRGHDRGRGRGDRPPSDRGRGSHFQVASLESRGGRGTRGGFGRGFPYYIGFITYIYSFIFC